MIPPTEKTQRQEEARCPVNASCRDCAVDLHCERPALHKGFHMDASGRHRWDEYEDVAHA